MLAAGGSGGGSRSKRCLLVARRLSRSGHGAVLPRGASARSSTTRLDEAPPPNVPRDRTALTGVYDCFAEARVGPSGLPADFERFVNLGDDRSVRIVYVRGKAVRTAP